MSESKIYFSLSKALNTYKHISRNIGAIMTASINLVLDISSFHKKGI